MATSTRAWPAVLGVASGWLFITPSSVLTLALRTNEIGTPTQQYSLILTAGWGVVIAGTIAFGRLSDRLQGRATLLRLALVLFAATAVALNFALAQTYSTSVLAGLWVVLQIPVAAIVAIAMKVASQSQQDGALSRTSGYVGAMPPLTVLAGSVIVQSLDTTVRGFQVPAIIALVLLLPLLLGNFDAQSAGSSSSAEQLDHDNAPWRRFLTAEFLTSCTTAAVTSYLVPYAAYVVRTKETDLASSTSAALAVASVLSAFGSLLLGRKLRSIHRNLTGYIVGAALMTVGVAGILVVPSTLSLFIGGALIGFGFGYVNSTEFALTVQLNPDDGRAGERLGVMTSVTTIPYVAVPAISSVLLTSGQRPGLILIFAFAGLSSLAAILIMVSLRRVRQ